jgi:alkylated DNA repair dioxygenase AlkB
MHFYDVGESLPDPVLAQVRDALVDQYRHEVGGPFSTAGLCLYRDGRDSVAWHGDRIGRGATADTLVAIISLGATRRMLLRPRRGGRARRYELGPGDLLVMGGSCQRTWDHAIPKTTQPVGPRISIQFRPDRVR